MPEKVPATTGVVTVKGVTVDLNEAVWQGAAGSDPAQVQVAFVGDMVAMRDSRYPEGPCLIFTPNEWKAFLIGAKSGEFNV